MDYVPNPLDTSSVRLPDELAALTERLAENTHDLWAVRKLADGWTYGPSTDVTTKKHSDLVPYAELPEGKKAYDRDTAMGTLKLILTLGYTIVPPKVG
ncbi:MAG: Ryanodine receptor Ryr [Planctomycetes bacterium]|nr:Ryanodine receptor Ryr [Planctomycetota bacterium]